MSMTIVRSDWRCFLLRFWKMSQFSSCSSLKPTARWWFSSTDASLYIRASSESEKEKRASWLNSKWRSLNHWMIYNSATKCPWYFLDSRLHIMELEISVCKHTGVDEELVGHTRMINIMYGTSEQSSHDFEVSEDILEQRTGYCLLLFMAKVSAPLVYFKDKSRREPLKQVRRGEHVWIALRQQHGCYCDKPHQCGSGPLGSSWRWWTCLQGS